MAVAGESAVFLAIADPNRRRLLDLLADGDLPAQALADRFEISFGAVSQHLKVLREAGLVAREVRGRQRIYSLTPQRLKLVAEWTAHYSRFWEGRLRRLGEYLEAQPREVKR